MKKRITSSALFWLIVLAVACIAFFYIRVVYVYDKETGEPLRDVTVKIYKNGGFFGLACDDYSKAHTNRFGFSIHIFNGGPRVCNIGIIEKGHNDDGNNQKDFKIDKDRKIIYRIGV